MEIKIKKELSENEFMQLMADCEKKIDTISDTKELISTCADVVKRIIPADIVYFVKIEKKDEEKYILEYANTKRVINISTIDTSIIVEALQNKQPLIANDIQISFIYNKKVDNLIGENDNKLKDLLVIPVIEPKSGDVVAMIWAATYSNNLNQFIQKDMDYMIRFSSVVRKLLKKDSIVYKSKDKESEDIGKLQECLSTQERLKKELKYKDIYFSSIIHDVRAPMNALLGFLDLLKLKEADQENIEYIDSALKSGENIVTLINDALDLAKISSGKMNINKTEFSPHSELEDSAQIFANAALKKDICFSTYFDPAIPEKIISDPMRIRQIINNLLSNALKFTPENGSIDLKMIYEPDIDGMTIKVKDTGIGIAKDKQKKIFAPFEQESDQTAQKYGGTGLGLSIAMQLTILLGGKLKLESQEGKGSLFYFTIPCNTPPLVKATYEKNILHNKKIAICQQGKCKNIISSLNSYLDYLNGSNLLINDFKNRDDDYEILLISKENVLEYKYHIAKDIKKGKKVVVLGCDNSMMTDDCIFNNMITKLNLPVLPKNLIGAITEDKKDNSKASINVKIKEAKKRLSNKVALCADDNPINLKFMQELFKSLGIKMIPVSDGDDAVKEYIDKYDEIDIIFIDENMNRVNGTEAIEAIREFENREELPNVVIIGLTGDALTQTKDKMINAGANDVLVKPVRLDRLIDKLEEYFK